jgi:uncharacterized protein
MMRPRRISLALLVVLISSGFAPNNLTSAQKPSNNKNQDKTVEAFTDAAMRGDIARVKRFLKQGMNVNAEPSHHKGWTALMAATTFNRTEAVRFLLAAGAVTNGRLTEGESVLYQAAAFSNPEIVRMLLNAGAQLNETDNNGVTPLMRASWMGNGEIVKVLLAAGADVTVKDHRGQSTLYYASVYGDLETVRAFLGKNADTNERDENGETPLMWAARNRNNGAFLALLAAGAELNARSKSGETPLMMAAAQLDLRKVNILLRSGAEVKASDSKGWTALMFAAANAQFRPLFGHNNEFMERIFVAGKMAEDLIAAGADINRVGNDGKTALLLAIESGHGGIVKALLIHGANAQDVRKFGNRMIVVYEPELKRVALSKLLESFEDQ